MVREYTAADLPEMIRIWNEVVEDGVAFPQEELLDAESGAAFFAAQTCSAVAEEEGTGRILGLYILHPNNIGRCGHMGNASYAVSRSARGRRCSSGNPHSRRPASGGSPRPGGRWSARGNGSGIRSAGPDAHRYW